MWLEGRACIASSLSIYYNAVLLNDRSDVTYRVMFVELTKRVTPKPSQSSKADRVAVWLRCVLEL